MLAHGAAGGMSARLQGGRFERGVCKKRIRQNRRHDRTLAGGVAAATLGDTALFRQGGLLSKALNVIPAMNSTAALHDYWFNSGQLEFSTFNNVGTMLPAAAISVSASVGNLIQGWQSSPIVWYFLTQPYDEEKRR